MEVKAQFAAAHGASPADAAAKGASIMGPGNFIKDPISALSFGLALILGTAGLPHILMRFFTVPDARQARKSVLWATTWIGYFYLLTFVIGFGAIVFVGSDSQYVAGDGTLRGGANMAAIHLSHAMGGDAFLGFISAVAFATILAVVAGLTLSGASAVSHDLYATVLRRGAADPKRELRISRITTLALGVVAVLLGILFERQNVAFMVSLAFAIAASGNVPVLLLSLYWGRCTGRGATIGGFLGIGTALGLTILLPGDLDRYAEAWRRDLRLFLTRNILGSDRIPRCLVVLDARPKRTGRDRAREVQRSADAGRDRYRRQRRERALIVWLAGSGQLPSPC